VDENRHALTSFRTFAVSELSLGVVLIMFSIHLQRKSGRASAIPEPKKSSCGAECRILLLASRALGLGAILTTLYLQFENEAEAALGLPPGFHSYALLPIGYPIAGSGQSAVSRWSMSSTKTDGANLSETFS
jgi:hypothetical protein